MLKCFLTKSAAQQARKCAQDRLRSFSSTLPTSNQREQYQQGSTSRSDPGSSHDKDDQRSGFFVAPSVDQKTGHRAQYNVDPFSPLPTEDHYSFPLVTAADLAKSASRPRKVRMLARDFIHDSLYNPHYGYFSRHAVLLPDGVRQDRSYDFPDIRSERDFMAAVEERYTEFEETLKEKDDYTRSKRQKEPSKGFAFTKQGLEAAQAQGKLDAARQAQSEKEAGEHDRDVKAMAARQVWHTPTELFKPHYARAIARYMLDRHASEGSGKPLRIYEVGAGSGNLAVDILRYIADHHPDIYQQTTYTIVEISPRLARQQANALREHMTTGKAKIVNGSILDHSETETEPCFFIALEVLDNLAHDVVRYSTSTMLPYQAIVSIDASGDMHELWEPVRDERIRRYLAFLQAEGTPSGQTTTTPAYLPWLPSSLRSLMTNHLPFYPNLSPPHYIPTGSLQLLEVLASRFPQHKAIISDFDALPDALAGLNAPVVQTRLENSMIPVTKYTVQQGFFDIFFPTNFSHLRDVHGKVTNRDSSMSTVVSHKSFLERYAEVDKTTCRDGSNPMLSWYANASWFLS